MTCVREVPDNVGYAARRTRLILYLGQRHRVARNEKWEELGKLMSSVVEGEKIYRPRYLNLSVHAEGRLGPLSDSFMRGVTQCTAV
jgi:hypothetical protein